MKRSTKAALAGLVLAAAAAAFQSGVASRGGVARKSSGEPALTSAAADPATSPTAEALSPPTDRADGLEDLWREEITRRIEQSFRDVYLQLISIVQGLAFTSLASEMASNWGGVTTAGWCRAAACFIAIIVIWHEYMIGSTMFAWTPTLLDAVIPFALGAGEFAMAYSVTRGDSPFLLAMLVTAMVGTFAYGNYWFHAHRGLPFNLLSIEVLRRHLRAGLGTCAGGSVFIFVTYLMRRPLRLDQHAAFVTIVLVLPFAGMALHSISSWNFSVRRLVRSNAQPAGMPALPK